MQLFRKNIPQISLYTGLIVSAVGLITFSLNWYLFDLIGGRLPGYTILLFPANLSLVYVWHPLFSEEVALMPKLLMMLVGQFVTVSIAVAIMLLLLNKLFKWEKGRQLSGYDKMLLCKNKRLVKFDVYLLRFNEGSEIKAHTDKVTTGKHYRLNIVLRQADKGGDFVCKDPIYQTKRIKFFRPDMSQHSVSKIVCGKRYVLSIGWLRDA